jgi:L-malate glycosyltransferase
MFKSFPRILAISNYRSTHTVRPEAEIFISLAKLGYPISVMTYPDAAYVKGFEQAGIKVIGFHPEKKYDKNEIAFIRAELKEGKYDVVHLFNSPAMVNGIVAAQGLDVKVILYRGYTGNISWWDPTVYNKYFHPRVDKIICNSIGVEALFRKQWVLNPKKLITINKGHKTEWYQDIPKADLSEFGIQTTDFVFVCVANNRPMKGVKYLMDALTYIPKNIPFKLLMVGHDLYHPSYEQLLDKHQLKDKVIFTGFRKDSLSIVASSSVFVLPSIKGESITKSVIEAMGLTIPSIITDIPGNVELVKEGVNGWIVPSKNRKALANAMQYCIQHPEQIAIAKENCLSYIQEYLNHQQTVDRYVKMYNSMFKA